MKPSIPSWMFEINPVRRNEPIPVEPWETRVAHAVSPTIDAERVEDGVEITVEDYRQQPQTVKLEDGKDGVSPEEKVAKNGSTTTITITDETGTTSATVEDGQDGEDGHTPVRGQDYWTEDDKAEIVAQAVEQTEADVNDLKSHVDSLDEHVLHISPRASVSKTGNVATITISDQTQTTQVEIRDGEKGGKGDKGDPGDDYALTAADKQEIAGIALSDFGLTVVNGTLCMTYEEASA